MTILMENMNNMYKKMTMMMNNNNNTYNNIMMGNNMGMNPQNFGNNDWMKGLQMTMNEGNQTQEEPGPKIKVVFKTTQGKTTNMIYKHGTTVGEALELYLKKVGRPDLINNIQGRLCFLVNAKQLKFNDTTKIEDFFKNTAIPSILVNDVNNLIGA